MYFGTENIPLSSSGGNLLQYLSYFFDDNFLDLSRL